jgi:hypothetical protein
VNAEGHRLPIGKSSNSRISHLFPTSRRKRNNIALVANGKG